MFEHGFREQETRTVKLTGKNYDDFLEFLLCLHPNTQNVVDKQNVLRVSPLAEEYQATLLIQKCKKAMEVWVDSGKEEERQYPTAEKTVRVSKICLQILVNAISLHYEDVIEKAVQTIAKFGYIYFTGTARKQDVYFKKVKNKHISFSCQDQQEKIVPYEPEINELENCKTLYDSLSDQMKVRLLSTRLLLWDDSQTR